MIGVILTIVTAAVLVACASQPPRPPPPAAPGLCAWCAEVSDACREGIEECEVCSDG